MTPEEEADLYWLKLLGDAEPEDVRKAAFVLLYQEMTRPRTETATPETAPETAAKPGTEAGTQTAAETGSAATQTENTNEWQAFDVLGRDADQEEVLKNQPDTDKYEYKIELNPDATADDPIPYVIYRRAKQGATQTAAETGSAATAAPAEIGTIQASEAAEEGEVEASARAERELKLRRELPHNPADTAAEIEKWQKLFPNANIQTTDAWTPEQIRILRQRGVLAPEKAQGMFDIKTNTVILNISNLRPSEVGFKILHEVGLHFGIRQTFGDEAANRLFLAVFDAVEDSPFMQRVIDAYKLRTPMLDENGEAIYNPDGTPLFDDMTDAQKAEAAEEFLAFAAETYGVPIDEIYADNRAEIDKWGREHGRDTHDWNEKRRMTREWMAETGFKPERSGWWKQLISQIRVWLAEHGFGHLREADIETIIQDSFKAANRTNRTNRTNDGTRFALPEDVASFERAIEDYKAGNLNPYQTVQVTSHTPNVLLRLDLKDKGIRVADRKITIPYSVIEKATGKKASTSSKQFHDLDLETLKQIPEQLYHPVMVLDSDTENSLEIYTTLFDQSNRPVMVSLLLNKLENIPGKRGGEYVVNSITSVYGKSNANVAFDKLFSGYGRYVNLKKMETWLRAAGIQSPGAGAFKSLPHTIVDDSKNASENGEKTRYSIDTPEFKQWFKDSKVVDEDGKPLVVYHDTNAKIYINKETGENWDELDWKAKDEWENRDDWDQHWIEQDFNTFSRVRARRSVEYPGFFFSPTPDPNHEYGTRRIAAFLSIQNPAINPKIEDGGVYDDSGEKAMLKLIEQGYDGIIRKDDDGNVEEYIAFYPEQIKSVDNVGTFDPNNPDIRYSVSPVWTGSAADYEQPSLNYVGTGEGNQVYGWGLYGSSSRGVGEGYAEADVERKNAEAYSLSNSLTIKGKRLRDDQTLMDFASSVYPEDKLKQCVAITISSSMRDASSFEDLVEIAKENGGYYMKSNGYSKEEWDAACEEVGEDIELTERKRNLYRQTFWPDKKENLLDWDEDLPDEQRDKIFAELEKDSPYKYIGEDQQYGKVFEHKLTKKHLLGMDFQNATGKDAYKILTKALGSEKAASEFLYRAGIDGVTYIGDTSGVRNYVAFSDKDIRVDEHIRFSVGGVDENLIVVHNVSEQKLRDAIKLGALPVPSIGIIDAEKSNFTDYGRITLVGDRDLIDPKNKKNKVFDSDIYSSTRPNIQRLYTDEEYDRALEVMEKYDQPSEIHDPLKRIVENHKYGYDDSDFESDLKNSLAAKNWYSQTKQDDEDFESWWQRVAAPELNLHPTGRIFDGFTNSGRRRYLPANLETIVKLMTRKVRDAEGFFYGFGNIRSNVSKQFKSIAEIQKSRDKIVSDEDYKAIKKEVFRI